MLLDRISWFKYNYVSVLSKNIERKSSKYLKYFFLRMILLNYRSFNIQILQA
jgi:hypothetical protein